MPVKIAGCWVGVPQGPILDGSFFSRMQTVESLRLLPVWLNPDHLVATARVLMSGHNIKSLGVLDGDKLVGIVSAEAIAALQDDMTIESAMEPPANVIDATMPIRSVAEMFIERGIDRAPVMHKDRFVGILNAAMLLSELRRSWDPLTGLSWSDALREWGIEKLGRGNEIVVIFIDLNDFGAYNKRYGHVVGDGVLQKLAFMLREHTVDDDTILVRYGGDEFAIGIVGESEDGEALVEALRRRSGELRIDGAEEPITYSVGLAGGKRGKERENTHYAATLDNLISIASRNCLAEKQRWKAAKPVPLADVPTIVDRAVAHGVRVLSVVAEENSPTSLTQVVLGAGDSVVSGVHARMGRPVPESVAIATSKAVERAYPATSLEPKAVSLTEGPSGERIVTVLGTLQRDSSVTTVSGARTVGRDLYTSVAEATLEAFFSVADH